MDSVIQFSNNRAQIVIFRIWTLSLPNFCGVHNENRMTLVVKTRNDYSVVYSWGTYLSALKRLSFSSQIVIPSATTAIRLYLISWYGSLWKGHFQQVNHCRSCYWIESPLNLSTTATLETKESSCCREVAIMGRKGCNTSPVLFGGCNMYCMFLKLLILAYKHRRNTIKICQ